jgi:hypothetical protein
MKDGPYVTMGDDGQPHAAPMHRICLMQNYKRETTQNLPS